MPNTSLNGYPFRVETNVNAKVVGANRKLKQNIDKHNMATANLTEGIVKFLRGEFTESYISGLLPNIGNNFNIADQYIPTYMGMGVAGVEINPETRNLCINRAHGFAPSYADTELISEVVPLANPKRAIVSKSVRGNANLSQASSLIISTAYHFEDAAQSQLFVIEPSATKYEDGHVFYLSSSLYPGSKLAQRIKSLSPNTAGWTYIKTTSEDANISQRETGMLYYTADSARVSSAFNKNTATAVLSVDFNKGTLTVVAKNGWSFLSGLEISYDPVNFDFIHLDNVSETVPYTTNGLERTYCISELGLFSGDISNENSKLLARVMLDENTPMLISEGDYVVITWQIGVYALDDSLYVDESEGPDGYTESTTLDYITQEEQTDLLWGEIKLDENGNPVEEVQAPTYTASYNVLAIDLIDLYSNVYTDTNKITDMDDTDYTIVKICIDNVDGLYSGFPASFSYLGSEISGIILDIQERTLPILNTGLEKRVFDIILSIANPDLYKDNPILYTVDNLVLSEEIKCHQILQSDIPVDDSSIDYTFKITDVTFSGTWAGDIPDAQMESSGVLSYTGHTTGSAECNFKNIYYLFGVHEFGNETSNTLKSNIYYELPSISECSSVDLGYLHYYYEVCQDSSNYIGDIPIIFDTRKYLVHIEVARDHKTNIRSTVVYKYVLTDDNKPIKVNDIIFENRYNPTVMEG